MITLVDFQTMYRVMILFMLDRVEYPLTNTQITNFVLDRDYTDYFNVQRTLSDLLSSELITAESTHNNTRYRITETGKQTLHYFDNKISPEMKQDILSFLREHNYDLKQETSVFADYFKAAGKGYGVRCQAKELEQNIIDLTLFVETKEQAEAICRNWQKENAEVYALLMDTLLK